MSDEKHVEEVRPSVSRGVQPWCDALDYANLTPIIVCDKYSCDKEISSVGRTLNSPTGTVIAYPRV